VLQNAQASHPAPQAGPSALPQTRPSANVPSCVTPPPIPSSGAQLISTPTAGAGTPSSSIQPLTSSSASFPGLASAGSFPGDTNTAAGTNDLLEIVNEEWNAYTKAGANELATPWTLQGWYVNVLNSDGLPSNTNIFDPQVMYDQFNNRYIMTAVAGDIASGQQRIYMSVSKPRQPTETGAPTNSPSRAPGSSQAGTVSTTTSSE
jgi:hypothetical protein